MAETERIYTVPLKFTKSVPRSKRTKHALTQIKKYVMSHMKADPDHMWVDPQLSQVIWAKGIQNPPNKVRVRVIKFDDDFVEISMPEE